MFVVIIFEIRKTLKPVRASLAGQYVPDWLISVSMISRKNFRAFRVFEIVGSVETRNRL